MSLSRAGAALGACAVLLVVMASAAPCQEPPIALSVEVAKRDVVLWEPIFAKLHVRNTSDAPVRMVPTYEAIRVRSVREEGPANLDSRIGGGVTWWGIRGGSMASPAKPSWLLEPGEELTTWMGLLDESEMQEPGTYRITLEYAPREGMVREPPGADLTTPLWDGTLECDAGTVVVRAPVGPDLVVADHVLPPGWNHPGPGSIAPRWHIRLGWCYPESHVNGKYVGDVAGTAYEPYLRWYVLWSKCLWHVPIPPNPLKGGPGPEAGYPAAAVRQFVAEYPDFPLNELADVAIAYGALHQAYADSVREADRLVDEKKLPWHGSSQYWRKVWSLWKPRLPEAWATVDAAVAKCQDRAVKDESAFVRWRFDVALAYREKEQQLGTE